MDKTELLLQLVKLLLGDKEDGSGDDSEVENPEEDDLEDEDKEQEEPSDTQNYFTKTTDQKPVVNVGANTQGGRNTIFPSANQARTY